MLRSTVVRCFRFGASLVYVVWYNAHFVERLWAKKQQFFLTLAFRLQRYENSCKGLEHAFAVYFVICAKKYKRCNAVQIV